MAAISRAGSSSAAAPRGESRRIVATVACPTLTDAPRVTVILNGIVVQNNEVIRGARSAQNGAAPVTQGPLQLQEHHHPVRYRNIWVRRLADRAEPGPDYVPSP